MPSSQRIHSLIATRVDHPHDAVVADQDVPRLDVQVKEPVAGQMVERAQTLGDAGGDPEQLVESCCPLARRSLSDSLGNVPSR
ncbi:MAG: hypothetical protein U0575_02665 [Phycisphaerales bacterium]